MEQTSSNEPLVSGSEQPFHVCVWKPKESATSRPRCMHTGEKPNVSERGLFPTVDAGATV